MRIAYFTESLPPLTDGVSHTLTHLQESLESENHDYIFYSPFRPDRDGWVGNVFKLISVPFPLYTSYKLSLPAFHDLRFSLDRFRPEIIHICSPFFLGLAASSYAREAGIPVINSFHTRFVSYLKYYRLAWFELFGWQYLRWFYNRCDMSLVPSVTTIRELRSRGFSNLELWARGIDTRRFSPRYADRNLKDRWSPDGKPIALFVGRLVKEKDINILLEAYEILKAKNIECRLVFVGDGHFRRRIERIVPDAILTGHLEGDDLSRAYASADFFVFPSTTESFGNVVLEAAASGLPTVGAAEGGIKDLIKHGETGFLAKPRDPVDFALNMKAVIADDTLRNSLAAGALELASQRSWEHINRGLFQKYRILIHSRLRPNRVGKQAISQDFFRQDVS